MATIDIYSPSSHSQTVYAPATVTARAEVTNYGRGWGYARMRINDTYGPINSIRPGVTINVRTSAGIYTWMEGQTITANIELLEVTSSGERIRVMTDHRNFRITVAQQTPPVGEE